MPGRRRAGRSLPFFNLYWVFPVWYGFARDYNAYLQRHGLAVRPLPTTLYLAHAILMVLCAVPYLNLVMMLPALVTTTLVIVFTCGALDRLATGQERPGLLDLGPRGLAVAGGGLPALALAGLGFYFVCDYWNSWSHGQRRLQYAESRLQLVQQGTQLSPIELKRLESDHQYYQSRVPQYRTRFWIWVMLTLASLAGVIASGWILFRMRRRLVPT